MPVGDLLRLVCRVGLFSRGFSRAHYCAMQNLQREFMVHERGVHFYRVSGCVAPRRFVNIFESMMKINRKFSKYLKNSKIEGVFD